MRRARLTLARISSADFCPDEGFGVGIVMVEVVVEAASSSGTEVKTPRRMRSWVIKPKKRSTPAAPDPRQTARRRSLCSSANYCTIPLKRKSSVSLSTLADYRERVGRRHVLTRRDVEGTVEFIADPPLRGSFRCRLLCCDQVPERAGRCCSSFSPAIRPGGGRASCCF